MQLRKILGIFLCVMAFEFGGVAWCDTTEVSVCSDEYNPISNFLTKAKETTDQSGLVDLLPLFKECEVKYELNPGKKAIKVPLSGRTIEIKNDVAFIKVENSSIPIKNTPIFDSKRILVQYSDLDNVVKQVFKWNAKDKNVEIVAKWVVDSKDTVPLRMKKSEEDFNTLYTTQMIRKDIQDLKEAYPGLIKTEVIGISPDGNPLNAITVGTGNKNPVVIIGAVHGREYHTSKYIMYELFSIANAWEKNTNYMGYDLRTFLNEHTLHIIPVMNPDGVNISQLGYQSSKNGSVLQTAWQSPLDHRLWKADSQGINPNRNFDFRFKEPSGVYNWPHFQYSKGTRSEESLVVKAVASYLRKTPFHATIQLHEKGKIIYWSDKSTQEMIKGNDWFAKKVSELNGYKLMPVTENLSFMQGGLENWARQTFKKPSLCMEMGTSNNSGVPIAEKDFKTDIFDENRGFLLHYAELAKQWNEEYGQK